MCMWKINMTYPGVINVLLSEHIATSHCATNWQPAAAARPLTQAIIGTGASIMENINSDANLKTFSCCFFPLSTVYK